MIEISTLQTTNDARTMRERVINALTLQMDLCENDIDDIDDVQIIFEHKRDISNMHTIRETIKLLDNDIVCEIIQNAFDEFTDTM